MDCVIGPAQRTDADALPLLIYSSPGPSLIRNNELFATGQCMFFGGAGVMPREERVAPQDVVFQRNWLRKLERWNVRSPKWDQVNWVIKPGIESKNSLRVLVEGNLIENSFNWPAVHITSRYTLDWTIQHNAAVNCITMLNLWDTSNIENGPGLKRFQFYGTDATLQASVVTPGDFDVAQNAMLETFTSHKGPAYTQGNWGPPRNPKGQFLIVGTPAAVGVDVTTGRLSDTSPLKGAAVDFNNEPNGRDLGVHFEALAAGMNRLPLPPSARHMIEEYLSRRV